MEKLYENSYAVIIAIRKLDDPKMPYPEASNAINDADEIYNVLSQQCDFHIDNIHILKNSQATREAILSKINEITSILKDGDRFVFFYAGHGDSRKDEEDNETGFIIPFDARWDGSAVDWTTAISFNDLVDDISNSTKQIQNQILFLIDCCFSGIACKLREIVETINSPLSDMKKSTKRKSVEVFAASNENEKILDSGSNPSHSIFSQHILDFINSAQAGEFKQGYISARNMANTVITKVVAESLVLGHRQEPQFLRAEGDQLGEFVIKQFSDKEIQESQTKEEMEFSEIDRFIFEADLFDIIRKDFTIKTVSHLLHEKYPNRPISISIVCNIIFNFLKNDEYVTKQLESLKKSKNLSDEKINEVLHHLTANIIARGIEEKTILNAVPEETPNKKDGEKIEG